ncbi:MAG: hypothetical protein K2N74_01280, partial [Clostridiales bacterium]|nr:hypothetical protein [Clostridiales bacterium]
MAIAVMRKLRVAAVSYEEDKILDALSKTGAVEIKLLEEKDAARPVSDAEAVSARLEEAEGALKELFDSSERYAKEHKKEFKPEKDGFLVSYEEFMSADKKRDEAEELIAKIKGLAAERVRLNASLAALEKTILSLAPYKDFEIPFSSFSNSPRVRVFLGTAENAKEELFEKLPNVCVKTEGKTVLVIALKEAEKETEELLRELDFVPCPFLKEKGTGKELYARLNEEKKSLLEEIEKNA